MEKLNVLYTVRGEEINLDEITIADLKKEAMGIYLKLVNKRNSLK